MIDNRLVQDLSIEDLRRLFAYYFPHWTFMTEASPANPVSKFWVYLYRGDCLEVNWPDFLYGDYTVDQLLKFLKGLYDFPAR